MSGSGFPVVDKLQITIPIDISEDDDLTAAFNFQDFRLMTIHTPSGWDAANIVFSVSNTQDGTFSDLYDADGNQIVITAAASRALGVTGAQGAALAPCHWVKIGTTAGQTADRSLIVEMAS